jgi:segregation and condensation protein B
MDTPTRQGLEAMLFLADEPVEVEELAEVLEAEPETVAAEVEALAARYAEQERGIEIRRAAGGWRMYSAAAARPVLERWALAGRTGRLTQAALETLAVIAYKQPISRQEIGDIRGVNADGAVRSLAARGFVTEVGRDEGPGQAVLYGTTSLFLERIGVDDLEDLPPLTDFLPEAPAPDEPELGAIREARRRLAQAGAGTGALGEGGDPSTNTGPDPHADDDALPTPERGRRNDTGGMDDLTDQLDRAARSAVDRLRQAVSATEQAESGDDQGPAAAPDEPDEPSGSDPASGEEPDEAAGTTDATSGGGQEPHGG